MGLGRRLQLDAILTTITEHVYFQPPEDIRMEYPCVVYEKAPGSTKYADNKPYAYDQQYELKLITEDPDDPIFDELVALSMSKHSQSYVAENLYHHVFAIFH